MYDNPHDHAHSHAHAHGHGHSHGHDAARPAYLAALGSDAGHMFSDSLALALAAGAAWLARRPPGDKHSYGLARAEVIAASLNGLLMLAIIVLLVVEAVQRLLDPQPVMAIAVMVI